MEEKRKPRLWLICLAFVMLLVAYPLSEGPLDWLRWKGIIPISDRNRMVIFYAPAHWFIKIMPQPIYNAYDSYLGWWLGYDA